jgi:hypothetical protein
MEVLQIELARHPWRCSSSPLCGCATHAQSGAGVKTDIQDLQNRIYELQKRNAEAQVEIQDLRDKEARGGASGPSSPASLSKEGR